MLKAWVLAKLDDVKDSPRVLLRDPLRLLPYPDGSIHNFGVENGFSVVVAATNLAFRDVYEKVLADPGTKKVLVLDRCSRRQPPAGGIGQAPAPFYPDLLAVVPKEARVDLDLRQFLQETTNDRYWPVEVNEPGMARLIVRNLDGVLRAHGNLRTADPQRFTDSDLHTIVAFAALGAGEVAFKKLGAEDYWKLGLLRHEALRELDLVLPEGAKPILAELRKAPAPFRWFAERDPETVVRAFYLSAILEQHLPNWPLLLANVDPSLAPLTDISAETLHQAGAKLVALSPSRADDDLAALERSLSRQATEFVLLEQLRVAEPGGFAATIERERYSTLVRSLALLMALDDLLSASPSADAQARALAALRSVGREAAFVEGRTSPCWSDLRDAYLLASDVQALRGKLAAAVKRLGVLRPEELTYGLFRELWNDSRINRLEYYLSSLERLAFSGALLPRPEDDLASAFANALARIRKRVGVIAADVGRLLDELNARFQDLIAHQYPEWLVKDGDVVVTSRFLRRCLKPHWDPQKEKAVLLIFDGMRYDLWEELLKPMLLDRMEIVTELPGCSLLPSETHISRKAICAGAFPDEFDGRAGEDKLLTDGLGRELALKRSVEVAAPTGAGTGETVRYRAGNLDVYIFDLCDKELHNIPVKVWVDGREAPARPLALVYEQIKNVVQREVMAIVRDLPPKTKVFVTADHGFRRVAREAIWFEEQDLNEAQDCAYQNCWLRVPFEQAYLPPKVRSNLIAFTPEQLRMPRKETRTTRTGQVVQKEYGAVAFPRVGYSFSRRGSPYNPDAYSHGGISIQELLVPMVVLGVRPRDEGLLALEAIAGPKEVVEAEEVEFRMRIRHAGRAAASDEVRVDADATCGRDPESRPLPRQVLFVPAAGAEVVYRFRPDPNDATDDERRAGLMERVLTISIAYHEGHRVAHKAQTHRFAVRLNSERVVRRVGSLGSVLGLTPKSMRD